MGLEYLDFELEIGAGAGREYPIAVLSSPTGEAHTIMRFPFDEDELASHLQALEKGQGAQPLGQALFDALIAGEVRSRYDASLTKVADKGQGLRVKLRIAPPQLAVLPWELLYDARRGEFVCLAVNTPLIRYLELPQPPQPLEVTPPLRVLGMIANPIDLTALDVEQEKARVEEALADLVSRGLVELAWLPGQTWRDLQQAMRRGPWHMFHFVGHGAFDAGAGQGVVLLAGEEGASQPLRAAELGACWLTIAICDWWCSTPGAGFAWL